MSVVSFENGLRARLKADAGVQATGSSVEWVKRPQGSAYPGTVLQVVSEPRQQTMTGWSHRWARVQIDVLALDAPGKVALREAIIAVIGARGVAAGVRFSRATEMTVADLSEQDDTQFIHRDMIDAIIWYKLET